MAAPLVAVAQAKQRTKSPLWVLHVVSAQFSGCVHCVIRMNHGGV